MQPASKIILSILAIVLFVSAAHADVKDRVRVGVLLPLTGEYAAWGEGIRRAIELSESTPDARFTFDFQDEGNCEPQKSLSGFRRFMTDKVHFVILGCLAGTKAILPVAKREKVSLLSVGLMDDAAFGETTQLINLATQLSTESGYLAKRVVERGFRRIAILHWVDSFSEEFSKTLVDALKKLGADVIVNEGVNPKERDFRSIIIRIKKANPDAFCFNVGQDQQEVLLRQIEEMGLPAAVFSNYVFETPPVLKLGKLAERSEYTFPLNSADSTSSKKEFEKQFEGRFGSGVLPTPNSYFIHDGLALLEKALTKCASEDPDCVTAFFKQTKSYSGLSREISFRSDGSNERPYGVKAVRDGKFVWAEKKS